MKRINKSPQEVPFHKIIKSILKTSLLVILIFAPLLNYAQETKTITIDEAITLGLANSKTLRLSKSKVEQAISVYNQTLDKALPSAKASAIYNHAEIPAHVLQLGPGDPIRLPSSADAYIGTLSIQELIFAGNKLKYAKESTDLLKKMAELDVNKDKNAVTLSIIDSYLNLYKLEASKKLIDQNLSALDTQLKQTQRFFDQDLVTKNDVLRLQLQKSNVLLTSLDLDRNENIVNYNLNILLGLEENTMLKTVAPMIKQNREMTFNSYVASAMLNREELKQIDYRKEVAEQHILSLKADKLPTLGAGFGAYYVNPSGKIIPPQNQFITPLTLGLTLSWDIGSLWSNKNKVAEATIQKTETEINKSIILDNIKLDIKRNYENYVQSLNRIEVISGSIDQAVENDKIVQSKYTNNIASITDRLDADVQLFQTKINLEIAKADAQIAYYSLLKSAGQL